MTETHYWQAIRDALREEMLRDPKVFVMGEDVAAKGVSTGFAAYRMPHDAVPELDLAEIDTSGVEAMPGGGPVAFWHTMPHQFAVKAIDLGVPAEMNTPDRRQRWLEIIRAEMQAALKTDGNRFLSGWMTAHPITLRTGECADDRDP